ncbi:hypothetical protein CURE108131_18870 [Cupriavidus respiraculi]|uniref:KfrA N-terminal DNA-binding domain-containing protein n=1 Tax=Cupriavidus respiraculi TaxID=195930 RepID=A0ABM8XUQ4_9BURK|nr:hypothetical protein [Cupriavidus respiraculi]MBY4949572.1 hypothetical protein [Cupriavidus respiraculi]CAG9184121.1 hypothetical protein LMG21510_05030 [Cupriavidus respiraculi]
MSDSDLLAQISAIAPRTKAARLRALMPAIEAKLATGASAQDVVAVLERGGLSLSLGTFRNYLARYRRNNEAAAGTLRSAVRLGRDSRSTRLSMPPSAGMPRVPQPIAGLHEAMYPDAAAQAESMAQYERLGKALARQNPSGG